MRAFITCLLLTVTTIASAFDATIPVLDMNDFNDTEKREKFIQELEVAMRDVGFFALLNMGVDGDILDEAYAELETFFAAPLEKKNEIDGLRYCYQRGFAPGESAKDEGSRVDFKQFLHIGPEENCPNLWPTWQPALETKLMALYNALDVCAKPILEAFALVLEQPIDTFTEMVDGGDTIMRPIYYPKNGPSNSIWAGAHTDIDLCTILPRSTAKGLQVLNKDGEWKFVTVPDGAFVVNCGDMLENVANGLCKSSVHRVIDPGLGVERYSIVHFIHPRPDVRLDPAENCIAKSGGQRKYAHITRQELLMERLIDLGLANHDGMKWFVETGAIDRLREVNRFSPKAEANLKKASLL